MLRRDDLDQLKILPIKLPAQARPVGVVTLKDRTLNPGAQLFIECAREVAGPLAKGRQRARSLSL